MRMRKVKLYRWSFVLFIFPLVVACERTPAEFEQADEALEIYPDYTSVIIPPNIAPLNFLILNQGEAFVAEISNGKDRTFSIASRTGCIQMPEKRWKKMLDEDRGGALTISVFRKTGRNKWEKLAVAKNEIAAENIDPYIAFRKIAAANILWERMGIYQRCLENFEESPIMVNSLTDNNCINCHTFNAGDPDQFLFHMRAVHVGTFIRNRDGIQFVDTKSDHTRSAGVYASWHPDGELIAFSANKINQGFHSRIGKLVSVIDKFSDIVLYDVKASSITRPAELATEKLENLPVWSKDGSKMYYICADKVNDTLPYENIIYSLMSIGFDEKTREFGNSETLISAKEFGKSISFPRESPSSGLISFVGLDYGYFSVYNKEADVYFYNPGTGQITKPPVNSEFTESYPSWSQNGCWLMFISKRDDGLLSQVWFSHIDENGNAGKPFVLPQKRPDLYKEYEYNYNRPEFISGKVDLYPRKVYAYVKNKADTCYFNKAASVSLSSGATVVVSKPDTAFYNHD